MVTSTNVRSKPARLVFRCGGDLHLVAHRQCVSKPWRPCQAIARRLPPGGACIGRHATTSPRSPPARAPPPRRPRRGGRSGGTCPGSRRPATAAPHRLPEPARSTRRWRRQAVVVLQRHAATGQRGFEGAGIPADQCGRARKALHRRGQRRKVLALPSPPRISTACRCALGAQAFQCGHGWRRRWCLAVVEGLDAADAGPPAPTGAARRGSRAAHASIGASGKPMAVARASAASALAALWRPRMPQRIGRHQLLQVDVRHSPLRSLTPSSSGSARTSQAMPCCSTRPKSPAAPVRPGRIRRPAAAGTSAPWPCAPRRPPAAAGPWRAPAHRRG